MKYIVSYKVAQSFNIGMEIDDENVRRYTQGVIDALVSGHALFEEIYEYPIQGSHVINEHEPGNQFFTYLDFKIEDAEKPDTDGPHKLEQLRERLISGLLHGALELVILWRRNFEAHIVFEMKAATDELPAKHQ